MNRRVTSVKDRRPHKSSSNDAWQSQPAISNADLIGMNKLVQDVQVCVIDDDDQLLTIIRHLLPSLESLSFIRNRGKFEFFSKYLAHLEASETHKRMGQLTDLTDSEQSNFIKFCSNNGFTLDSVRVRPGGDSTCSLFSQLHRIVHVDVGLVEMVQQMLAFDPQKRISESHLKKCKKIL